MKVLIRNHQRHTKVPNRRIRTDSLRLLKSFGLERAELGILLVNDERMKKLNALYRGIAKTTDVLSFPMYAGTDEMPDEGELLLGDIIINVRAAGRQADEYDVTFYEEVRRLLIHGFLHLLGYDHEKNRYQALKMRRHETQLRDILEALD